MSTKNTKGQSGKDNRSDALKQIDRYKAAVELTDNVEIVTFDTVGKTVEGIFNGLDTIPSQYGERVYWSIVDGKGKVKLVSETMIMAKVRKELVIGDHVAVMLSNATVDSKGQMNREFRVFRF